MGKSKHKFYNGRNRGSDAGGRGDLASRGGTCGDTGGDTCCGIGGACSGWSDWRAINNSKLNGKPENINNK